MQKLYFIFKKKFYSKISSKFLLLESMFTKMSTLSNCGLFSSHFFIVQAALGPVALDLARDQNSSDEIRSLANSILVISVLSIVATAPLGMILNRSKANRLKSLFFLIFTGALLMTKLAPKWLKKGNPNDGEL